MQTKLPGKAGCLTPPRSPDWSPQHATSTGTIGSTVSPFSIDQIIRNVSDVIEEVVQTQKNARQAMLYELPTQIECILQQITNVKSMECRYYLQLLSRLLIACVIPILVPLVEAFRSVGFKWAQETGIKFSTILPLVFGTLILAFIFLMILVMQYGFHEFCMLANVEYAGFMMPSLIRTGFFVGVNFALYEGIPATLVVMVLKSALLPGILGEWWLTKKKPWMTQLWTIAALLLCIIIYTLLTFDKGIKITGMGLFYCIGAAQCDFIGGFTLEAGIRLRLRKAGVNQKAEKIRCQLMNEFWKVQFLLVQFLIFEMDFFETGLVRGWNMQIVVGTVITIPFYVAVYNYSCIAVGMLKTNIFSSVDIGATCILEFIVFGTPITTVLGLLITVITFLILIYSTISIDLRSHAKTVLAFAQKALSDNANVSNELDSEGVFL